MRLAEGPEGLDWNARKQRYHEMKQRYHDEETTKTTTTSENSTTVKYPENQHKEEAGNLGEGTD